MSTRRTVALMGATGSIGRQTLDVLRSEPDSFNLVSVAAGTQIGKLCEIAAEFGVRRVGVTRPEDFVATRELLGDHVEVVVGGDGLADLAADADIVVNAVVGFAGLPVTMAALAAGRVLALANKESFIAAAPLVQRVRMTPGARVLPIDSEHCAIYQCLADSSPEPGHPDVRRLLLTASGGPFRGWSKVQLAAATTQEALRHPTWTMGPKITIDSSTLMNKGLEVLEASALFGIEANRISVVVHPQSIVHSMVEYVDGSVIAQLSQPDMRLPIAYCLGRPVRFDHSWGAMDFTTELTLSFEPPDLDAFAAIPLAYAAAQRGGAAPAWLSAANEVAVASCLHGEIRWADIVPVVATVMDGLDSAPLETLEDLIAHDELARRRARSAISAL